MIIVTKIYAPTFGTAKMVGSFERHGYEVAILTDPHTGHGNTLRQYHACFKRAITAHEYFMYSDGADTFMQQKVEPPTDHILYSTEKACYPKPEMASEYPDTTSPWRYLNGGGFTGPIRLAIEFFERYGLINYPADINGQHEQKVAFLQALKDGFPIKLDTQCETFQTIAFAEPEDFSIEDNLVKNNITCTIPAVLHGNGLTPMDWIYKLHE